MKAIRLLLVAMVGAALMSAGFYGCAKKEVRTEEGRVESQKPAVKEAPRAPEEGKAPMEAKAETKEAPPGPKEMPEPVESARAEKALQDVHFDFDKYDIRQGDGDILRKNAGWLKDNPKVIVTIEGHCDERGTVEYNLALGERRAQAAKNYLVSLGIKTSRMRTISYGKSKPIDQGHDEAAWAMNRRAHFVVQ